MLYIFDLDGTLVESYGVRPLDGILAQLSRLHDEGHLLAVATNQAGPAWGLATGDPKYPTPESLGERFLEIAANLPHLTAAPWFVAVGDPRLSLRADAYARLVRVFKAAASPLDLHLSADPAWRKPEPQMLLAACAYYKLPPNQAVFVGDYETDAAAAAAASVAYLSIEEFL
jgi:phosphoglycolate phosphatase-like HAD superfamily hydrolase